MPLDGSPLAEGALAYLAAERLDCDAESVLVRTVPPAAPSFAPGMISYAEQLSNRLEQQLMEAHRYLDDVACRYLRGKVHRAYALIGYPAKAILEVVEAQEIDLIVMATQGRSGLDRLLHGSVAGHLLHHAQIPVLLLHGLYPCGSLVGAPATKELAAALPSAPFDSRHWIHARLGGDAED